MSDPSTPNFPEPPMPPEQLAGAPPVPTPFADLPKPVRRGDGPGVAVPFDPLGYHALQSLAEVSPAKPVQAEGVLTKAQIDAARRRANFVPKFTTLETMYASNPEILRSGKLRVERVQPQFIDDPYGRRVRVCGTLDFRHSPVSSEEFTAKFGGYKYRVFGLLDQENRENNGGPPQPVEVAVAEFDVPVHPNLSNLPVAELGMSDMPPAMPQMGFMPMQGSAYGPRSGMPMYPFYPPQQAQVSADSVLGPVLNFAERASQQRAQQPPLPDAFWEVVGKQGENAQQNIRSMAEQNARILEEQNRQLHAQLQEERRRAAEMAARPTDFRQTIEGVAQLVQAQKGSADSDVVRQLRDDHERALRRAEEDTERLLTRQREQHDSMMKNQRDDYERMMSRDRETSELRMKVMQERVAELERRLAERERELRDEIDRKERMAREEMQRQMDSMQRDHLQRISDMKESHNMFVTNLQQMHEREMRVRETVQSNTSETTKAAHAIEMRSLQNDLARMTGELSEKKRIVEQTMAEKNKPLLEQVKDLQEMTAAIQEIAGGTSDDDGADTTPGGDKWWNSPVAQIVAKTVLEKGAGLIEKLDKLKAEVPAGGLPPAAQQMPALPPSGRVGRLPPRRRSRVVFADSDGPNLRTYDDMRGMDSGDQGMAVSGPRPFIPDAPAPYQEAPAPPAPEPAPVRPPRRAAPAQSAPQAPESAQPSAPQPPAPSAAASNSNDWSAFAWMPMTPQETQILIMQLNGAFEARATPESIADSFVQQFPMEMVAQIPHLIPIQKLVESVRTSPATAALALSTGGGKRYLAEVWAQIQQRIDDWKASKVEPAQAANPGEKAS